jgi:predicted transcriptional regulator
MAKKAKPPAPVLEYKDVDLTKLAKAIDCWEQGMIDREVATELGVPQCYVSGARKLVGIKANFKHISTRARREAAVAMAEKGMDVHEIARLLSKTPALIRTWVEEGTDD